MSEADDEAEQRDANWLRGYRAAHVGLLREALSGLGYDGTEAAKAAWILEREAAISTLRSLCDDFGDNDWPDNLHLSDIIDKHLGRYLYENVDTDCEEE